MVVAMVTVGVATPTTAAEETVGAEEARLVDVVAREPARILVEVTGAVATALGLSLIHISEPTRLGMISYAVFCLKKKK